MANECFTDGWIDAHCHLADDRMQPVDFTDYTHPPQIGGFISSALCQAEYEFHRKLDNPRIRWTAGIHPYYEKSTIDDFDSLVVLCERKEIVGIGEIGLDVRKKNPEHQEKLLKMQLNLARQFDLPVVFHIVKRHNELFRILQNFPGIRGYVHGFNGSIELFRQYRERGLLVSIGGRITSRDSRIDTVREIVQSGYFLVETDAPYQKPTYIDAKEFTPLHLPLIGNRIASMTGKSVETVMDIQRRNIRETFGL